MIDIGTRKHGPFDPRYPRPRTRPANPDLVQPVDRESLDAREGEGGQVASRTREDGRGNGHRLPELATLPDGLDWAAFCALAFPGTKRHYFPAIAPWYQYQDRNRSQPAASRPSTAAPADKRPSARRSPALPWQPPSQPLSKAKRDALRPA
jgi:hypothetical protein